MMKDIAVVVDGRTRSAGRYALSLARLAGSHLTLMAAAVLPGHIDERTATRAKSVAGELEAEAVAQGLALPCSRSTISRMEGSSSSLR
jgi:hypothetical protein